MQRSNIILQLGRMKYQTPYEHKLLSNFDPNNASYLRNGNQRRR